MLRFPFSDDVTVEEIESRPKGDEDSYAQIYYCNGLIQINVGGNQFSQIFLFVCFNTSDDKIKLGYLQQLSSRAFTYVIEM